MYTMEQMHHVKIRGKVFCRNVGVSAYDIVVTKCQILRLKCTKFDFGRGPDADPAGPLGELAALLHTP